MTAYRKPRAKLDRPGRPAVCAWSAEDVQTLREIYLRTNRAENTGSMSMAVRIARHKGLLSSVAAQALARPSASKHYIPSSLRQKVGIPLSVFRHHRHPRNATLAGPYVPGTTRLTGDQSRRLWWGERYSFDDGSQNQIVCVPWPWGGSKEADTCGIRTCRGQWLVAHDDATSHIDAWVFTLRPRDSYREADAMGLVWRLCRDVVLPDEAVLEGGAWQSRRALAFWDAAGVDVIDARGRPHQKLVENWWNRAWTFLSHYADGQIGRFRGEMQRENELLMRCRAGTVDGREHFPLLPDLLKEFDECVDFLNADQIESRQYGTWTPAERKALDREQHPRGPIEQDLGVFAAPECHDVTVRRGGMVVCNTTSPLGIPHVYEFADEALMPLEGQKVRVLYDPFEPVVRAAILQRGRDAFEQKDAKKAKDRLVCVANCVNPPPLPIAEMGWRVEHDGTGLLAGIRAKRDISKAVRTEYRALVGAGRRQATEIRGPDGSRMAVEAGAGVGDGAVVGGMTTGPQDHRTTDNGPRTTDHGQRTTEDGQRTERRVRTREEILMGV